MKHAILFLMALALFSCNNGSQETNDLANEKIDTAVSSPNGESPIFTFEQDTYEFGTVEEGTKVEHDFVFNNSGKTPLIIANVRASCGCTTPEYPKTPIKPGESGVIKVVFDSQNQVGIQHKIITIQSNAQPSTTILHLKGKVN